MFFMLIGIGVFIYGAFYAIATCLVDCDLALFFYSKLGQSPRRFKGKVIFITGASSGIGEHLAYSFAKHGAKLVLTARRNEELQRVKSNCLVASNGQLEDKDVLVIPMDVTDIESHKRHFAYALRHFGDVDVLINNAGRSQRAIWDNIELSVDRQMFDLNVFAVVNLTRVAIEHFNRKGSGHVAVVSSLAGIIGVPYSGTYTATKHAIHGYFNALRTEKIGRSFTVTLLCPGPTFTNFLEESFTHKTGQKYNISTQPTDRRMTAARCADLCVSAMANKLGEAWMGLFPMMPFCYIYRYFPLVFIMALKTVGPEKLFQIRDSRQPILTEVHTI